MANTSRKSEIFILDTAIMIGHVGDGNFHIFTGVDPTIDDEIRDIQSLSSKVAAKALELGGTCTGEHGIGLGKIKYFIFTCHNNAYRGNAIRDRELKYISGKKQFLIDEVGEKSVDLMRQIKQVFDPKNLMNPGKIFF